jgi:hypothetical protein
MSKKDEENKASFDEPLPDFFASILWSYDFSALDIEKNKKTIILQTINYGKWEHWKWIAKRYGVSEVAKVLSSARDTEFRKPALVLAEIIFNVKNTNHALRSAH